MKNSYIIKTMRRSLLRQLIFPALLFVLGAFLLTSFTDVNRFRHLSLNQTDCFADSAEYLGARISVPVDELLYTGCDYTVNEKVRGHYYYTLIGSSCQFYILPSRRGQEAPANISSQTVKGRLYRMADSEYHALLSHMAADLGWTADGIASMSSPYALSDVLRYEQIKMFLWPAVALIVLSALFDLTASVFYILFPLRSPTFRHLKKYGEIRVLLPKVEMEMKHSRLAKAGTICLTNSYLINLDTIHTIILPLESVVRVYRHGHIRRIWSFLSRKLHISYYLYIVTDDGKLCEFEKKKKEDLETILKILERKYPDISLGYHE